MRLIDADALQRRICGAKCGCEYEDCGNEGDCGYDRFIFSAPTVDAIPVVRCCQCKDGIVLQHSDFVVCHRGRMKKMDFCSYGERKEGAD